MWSLGTPISQLTQLLQLLYGGLHVCAHLHYSSRATALRQCSYSASATSTGSRHDVRARLLPWKRANAPYQDPRARDGGVSAAGRFWCCSAENPQTQSGRFCYTRDQQPLLASQKTSILPCCDFLMEQDSRSVPGNAMHSGFVSFLLTLPVCASRVVVAAVWEKKKIISETKIGSCLSEMLSAKALQLCFECCCS